MEHNKRKKWRCRCCGLTHPQGQCPAFGKRCSKCRKFNHFAKVCLSRRQPVENDYSDNESVITVSTNQDYNRGYPAVCRSCGFQHPYGQCTAYGIQCTACLKYNHFAQVCFSRQKNHNDYSGNDSVASVSTNQNYNVHPYYDDDDDYDSDDALPNGSLSLSHLQALKEIVQGVIEDIAEDGYEVNVSELNIFKTSGVTQKPFNKCTIHCTNNHDYIFVIDSCGHSLYRNCLAEEILNSEEDVMRCPAADSCAYILPQAVIKKILTPFEFKSYISNEKSFRCLTDGCSGWCIYRKQPRFYQCSVCSEINCLVCQSIHKDGPCKVVKDTLNFPNGNNTEDIKEIPNNAKKSVYLNLLELCTMQLVFYPNSFQCLICFDDYGPMEGIILKECLHVFCRQCLQKTIEHSETPEVKCPFMDDYSCPSFLLEYEIKNILSAEDYEKRLEKTLSTAQKTIKHTFHCRTPDCRNWCEIEEDTEEFPCSLCKKINCIICSVIHENMTCGEYQESLFAEMSDLEIERLIRSGDAIKCPGCNGLLSKIDGCDGIQCGYCGLDICWVTKGRRWGPRGKGDWSGGCRCKYIDGEPCHPDCRNCH